MAWIEGAPKVSGACWAVIRGWDEPQLVVVDVQCGTLEVAGSDMLEPVGDIERHWPIEPAQPPVYRYTIASIGDYVAGGAVPAGVVESIPVPQNVTDRLVDEGIMPEFMHSRSHNTEGAEVAYYRVYPEDERRQMMARGEIILPSGVVFENQAAEDMVRTNFALIQGKCRSCGKSLYCDQPCVDSARARLVADEYIDWNRAAGAWECRHGVSSEFECRPCDAGIVETGTVRDVRRREDWQPQETRCSTCGGTVVRFDPRQAHDLPAEEVRKRWPRGHCCGSIIYASAEHYSAGDW